MYIDLRGIGSGRLLITKLISGGDMKAYRTVLINFILLSIIAVFGFQGYSDVSVEGSLFREKTVAAGDFYRGSIVVSNNGSSPRQIEVYQSDYRTFKDGKIKYGDPGEIPRSNANWIDINLDQVEIPAGEKERIDFEVQVPEDDLSGTYWSALMIEPLSPADEEGQGTFIKQKVRYCVKIVTNIGDTGKRKLKVIGADLFKKGEKVFFNLGLHNTGGRLLYPTVTMELYDNKTGEKVGKFKGGRKHIFPGNAVPFRIAMEKITGGEYKAIFVFDNGDEYVWGTQYKINI